MPWTFCWHNNNLGTLTSAPKGARNRSQRPIKSSGTPLRWFGRWSPDPKPGKPLSLYVGLEGLLIPRDRLALPGRVLWIGGDATLEVAAATDWGAKVYITFPVEPYLASLRDSTGTPGDEATIISVAELLCLLSLAAVQYRSWDGRVVL